jgi:tetratricopeptide (TPR) repeat protein
VYAHRGHVLELAGNHDAAMDNYRAMIAFADRHHQPAVRVDAMNRLNTVRIVSRGANTLPQSDLDEARASAEAAGIPLLIGRALWNYGLYYRFFDPFAAEAYLQQARAVALAAPSPNERLLDLAANAALDSMIAMIVCAKLRKALDYGTRAIEEYRALGNKQFLADAIGGVSLIQYYQGVGAAAQTLSEEGVRISQEIDSPWGVTYNEWRLAEMEIDRGDYSRVIGRLAVRRAVAHSLGFPIFIGMVVSQAARAYLNQGRPDLALPLCDESADAFESVQQASWMIWAAGIRALPRLRLGDLAAARRLLEPVWRAGESYALSMQGFMQAGPMIAEWALTDGRIEYGLCFCDWALQAFEAEDALRLAGEMRYWRGRLRHAAGDDEGARADLHQARAWLAGSDALLLVTRVDEALAQVG